MRLQRGLDVGVVDATDLRGACDAAGGWVKCQTRRKRAADDRIGPVAHQVLRGRPVRDRGIVVDDLADGECPHQGAVGERENGAVDLDLGVYHDGVDHASGGHPDLKPRLGDFAGSS